MHLLLDTHLYIWWLKDDKRLSKKARALIVDADIIYISSVSMWEAAVKIQLGKLDADINDLIESIEKEGFVEFPLTVKQVTQVANLPNHYRDPFDRMLIAQAISEPLRFLTADTALKQYSELVDLV